MINTPKYKNYASDEDFAHKRMKANKGIKTSQRR
jgi:hypothetical protein